MRFYTETHKHYCGIDLHARTMYVCILDREGKVLLHQNLPCDPERFLARSRPTAKTWSSPSSASSTGTGSPTSVPRRASPSSSATPSTCGPSTGPRPRTTGSTPSRPPPAPGRPPSPGLRLPARDASHPGPPAPTSPLRPPAGPAAGPHPEHLPSVQPAPAPGKRIAYRANREAIADAFEDPSVNKSLEADLALIDHYDKVIRDLEITVLRQARVHDLDSFERLNTIPGIGKILALTILYEIHDIDRFVRSRSSRPIAGW